MISVNSFVLSQKEYDESIREERNMEILKVSSRSAPNSVAGAIAGASVGYYFGSIAMIIFQSFLQCSWKDCFKSKN